MKKQLTYIGSLFTRRWRSTQKPSEDLLNKLTLFALLGFGYCILVLAICTRGG